MRLYYTPDAPTLRVTLSPDDVAALAATWPGSGLEYGDRLTVELDAKNGDLLGYSFTRANRRASDRSDLARRQLMGLAPNRVNRLALDALLANANDYAAKRLGRPELAR